MLYTILSPNLYVHNPLNFNYFIRFQQQAYISKKCTLIGNLIIPVDKRQLESNVSGDIHKYMQSIKECAGGSSLI